VPFLFANTIMAPPPAPLPDIGVLRFVMMQHKELMSDDADESITHCKYQFQNVHRDRELSRVESECDPYLDQVEAIRKKILKAEKEYHRQASANQKSTQQAQVAVQEARKQLAASTYYHKVCVISTLCPRPLEIYANCFRFAQKSMGDEALHNMSRQRFLDRVCKPEREILQRCIGRLVSSSVEEALYPAATNTTHEEPGWFGTSADDRINNSFDARDN
jgi:hypothetical protein